MTNWNVWPDKAKTSVKFWQTH